jgi:hypothetical protein
VCNAPCKAAKGTCGPNCAEAYKAAHKAKHPNARFNRNWGKKSGYKRPDKGEVVNRMLKEQRGLCFVCGETGGMLGNGTKGLVLDHCHWTGSPRAMLCGRCNAALGLMKENVTAIESLKCYAELCGVLRE